MPSTPNKTLFALALALSLLWGTNANRAAPKHAPTVARCRADAALWGNADKFDEYLKAEDLYRDPHKPNGNNTELARLPITDILARLGEMTDCAKIDPKNVHLYNDTGAIYIHVWGDRMINFLGRHNLLEQFQKEDAEGKR